MKIRKLGRQGLEVSELGFGCMSMSDFYAGRDEAESVATIKLAPDRGVTFLDTADRDVPIEETVGPVAADKGCTPAQLARAWVLAQGDGIVPIPGTKRRSYLADNLAAIEVELSDAELARIDEVLPPGAASGTRYPAAAMASVNR